MIIYIGDMEKLIKRKNFWKIKKISYNALENISAKLDVRTIAAYKKKINASNRIDSSEKYIKIFNDINNKEHDNIIIIGKLNQEKKLKMRKYAQKIQKLKILKKTNDTVKRKN